MTSTCWYCKRDVKGERNSRGILVWRDTQRGKTTCDKRGELDTEARSVTITMNRPDEYGRMRPASITKDICGKCGNSVPVLMSAESVDGAELESAQAEAAMWKAKYEASQTTSN